MVVILFGNKLFSQQIINNGGTIVMSGAAYMVVNNASFINNGTFTPSTGTVSFTGTTAYNIGTTGSSATNFYNLTNSNTTTGTVNADVTVANTLSVTAGTLACGSVTANGLGSPITNLTLLSTAGNTANVSAVGGTITGNVNVQRYIPNKRSWRLMTAPVSGSNSIFTTWQISNNKTANLGMYVSGASANISANGMDPSPKNTPSIKSWNYTNSQYVNIINTITSNISLPANGTVASNIGYFVFIRGDRNTTFSPYATPTITTLTSTGALQTGTLTCTASPSIVNKYTLVGNPYAAPIDFSTTTRTNLVNRFYAWDPLLNAVGGYVLVDNAANGAAYTVTPYSGSTAQTKILQSGQAFFVETATAAAASITFNESNKSSLVSTNTGFKPMEPLSPSNITSSIAANLYLLNSDSTTLMADGNLTQFNKNYSDSILVEDAIKFTNINENLGVLRHGVTLALESRPNLSVTDTIFLNLSRTTQRAYQFQFVPGSLEKSNLVGYLQDKYLNTSTEISLKNNTPVNFTIDGNAASAAADRFQIVFKTVLPFNFTCITATKNNSEIAVEWKVANETDIAQYNVEKSKDGTNFIKVNTNLVKGNNNATNNYIWLDENAQTGENIYRVKMFGKDGSTKYTENVKVTIAAINTGISIYPNPIKEGKINIQMGNQPSGTYHLSLTNNNGQVIYTGTIQNNSNKSNFLINLNTKAAKGIYNLQITTPQNKITPQKLIVE